MMKPIKLNVEYAFNQDRHNLELLAIEQTPEIIALSPVNKIPLQIQPYFLINWKPVFHGSEQLVDIAYRILPREQLNTAYKPKGMASNQLDQKIQKTQPCGFEIAHFIAQYFKSNCEKVDFFAKTRENLQIQNTAPTSALRAILRQRNALYESLENSSDLKNRQINATLPAIQLTAVVNALTNNPNKYLRRVGDKLSELNYGSEENRDKLLNRVSAEKTREHLSSHNIPGIVDYFVPKTDLEIAFEK